MSNVDLATPLEIYPKVNSLGVQKLGVRYVLYLDRLVVEEGVLGNKTKTYPLHLYDSVDLEKSIFDSFRGSGNLVLNSYELGSVRFENMLNVQEAYEFITALIPKAKKYRNTMRVEQG